MCNWRKCSVVSLLVAALLFALVVTPAVAQEQTAARQASPEAMVFDFIFLRPLGVAATAIGTGFFIVSLPFSALGGNTREAAHKLVAGPARFTFARPLGELEH